MVTQELRDKWKHKLETIEEAIEVGQLDLTPWEQDFCQSVTEQLENGRDLSFKQTSIIYRLYDRIG